MKIRIKYIIDPNVIKILRLKKEFTHFDMYRKYKLSSKLLNKIEKGTGNVIPSVLNKLADIFLVDKNILIKEILYFDIRGNKITEEQYKNEMENKKILLKEYLHNKYVIRRKEIGKETKEEKKLKLEKENKNNKDAENESEIKNDKNMD
jgi:hypothetical protein